MSKKFFIQTWGCQMNDHDGEKLTGLMLRDGYEEVKSSKEADIVLLNTCSIREKAVHKVFSELGRLKKKITATAHNWYHRMFSPTRTGSSVYSRSSD